MELNTFFASTHGTITRVDPMLSCKTSLSKLERTDEHQSMFLDHSGIQLEINNGEKIIQIPYMWKLNNTLLSNCESKKK